MREPVTLVTNNRLPGRRSDLAKRYQARQHRGMTLENAVVAYLDAIAAIRATGAGTPETAHYPAITNLLDAIGDSLKPNVVTVPHPSGSSGIPDFGLFERRARRAEAPGWVGGAVPERGVVEAKPITDSIDAICDRPQVRERYLPTYRLVLVTNLYQWRLLDSTGALRETFDLAADQRAFLALLNRRPPATLLKRFADFLQRCLLTRAPLASPKDVAFFLASYARDALSRLEDRAALPGLATLKRAMETSLGIEFRAGTGEHLFRSTLVQTLFYGIFSAWVAHVQENPGRPFDWRGAQWSLHVPVARFLFSEIANPDALAGLEIVPLLDAAQQTLARVECSAFFAEFETGHAIQYFYEPFLEFFDPALRKEMGVWYTPPEIVRYMVERVDRLLRSELGIADGLADPSVWVLDPCCGTGSFIVEVLARIRQTLEAKGLGDLLADRMREAASTRIVGFEIMTAPFIIAHWQVGEVLRRVQAPLPGSDRAAIYLTNALTGWVTAAQPAIPGYDTLVAEAGAAGDVKRDKPILVVLGNPPYNAFAGVSPASEGGLVEPYKQGLQSRWGIRKFNLDDLYVRFFRVAERRIAEGTGQGVLSFISNFSWLAGASYVVMRERLLAGFDDVWIDNLNGDSRETGKTAPDGNPDPSIFSTTFNRAGIRVGTAIATMVRHSDRTTRRQHYRFREFWGTNKREELAATLDDSEAAFNGAYAPLTPDEGNRFFLRPHNVSQDYGSWAPLSHLSSIQPILGLNENRGGDLVSMDHDDLSRRMTSYYDHQHRFDNLAAAAPGLAHNWAGFDARKARKRIIALEAFEPSRVRRLVFRPFDMRWAYVTPVAGLWNRSRPELQHILPEASGFVTTRNTQVGDPEGYPTFFTPHLCDQHAQHKDIYQTPIVENLSGRPRPNVSAAALQYLAALGLNADSGRMLWMHALATTYAPSYLSANASALRQGWPRIPLPANADLLRRSALLGGRIAALLDPDQPVGGVTEGAIRPELGTIAVPRTTPGATRDWRLTGWGTRTGRGMTMPGRGGVTQRPYAPGEAATEAHAALLGTATNDIALSSVSAWANIPDAVWNLHIGGYQVLKKWLSYRDASIIDRALATEEVLHIQSTARRLAAILLLGPELDAAHQACAEAHTPLPEA